MNSRFFALVAVSLLIGCFARIHAQREWDIVDPDDIQVRIDDYEVRELQYDDIFPNATDFDEGGENPWLRFVIEYELALEDNALRKYEDPKNERLDRDELWLEDLSITWTIVLSPEEYRDYRDERYAVRLQKTVRYTNVRLGEDQYHAAIYIEPRIVQRYLVMHRARSDSIYAHAAIRVARKTQAEVWAWGNRHSTSEREARRSEYIPLDHNGRVTLFLSEDVKRLTRGLLPRTETPWEWSSYDSFETIVEEE